MGSSGCEFPLLLNSREKISYVRFLMAWMDAAPTALPGQVHRRLLFALDSKSDAARGPVDLSDDAAFGVSLLSAIVQWLSAAAGAPCASLVQCAFSRVMSDGSAAGDDGAAADGLLAAVRATEFRGTIVLLFFHGRAAVRVWARETALRLLAAAESERAVWLIGLRLLCCIRHLAACAWDAGSEGAQCVAADGFCGLFAVLAAVDARLVALEQSQREKEQNAHEAEGVPSSATILLLGGSMTLHWLIPAGAAPRKALASRVNARLGPAATLRPASLAADTRRGLVKTFVHCLIDHARSAGGGAEDRKAREAENARRAQAHERMCGIWHVAACVDAPAARSADPSARSVSSSSNSSSLLSSSSLSAPAKSAGWMLRVLYRNASAQLSLPAAVRAAKSAEPCAPDALRLMESAAAALDLFFASLSDALPVLAASRYFHEFLRAISADCAALACGVAQRSARPAVGIAVLQQFLRADVLAFSCGPAPAQCLRIAWEALPAMLKPPPQPQPLEEREKGKEGERRSFELAQCEIIRRVAEALDAALRPVACAWMFLRELRDGPQPLAGVIARCAERFAETVDRSMGKLQCAWEAQRAGELLSSGSSVPRVAYALMASCDTAARRVGNVLAELFLRTLEPITQSAFRSDAANWMLRVILNSHTLAANALQLHNPMVDAAARAEGAAWVNIMCLCNWENLSTDTLAATWWLCALVADVCVLEQAQRDRLLETAVTKLPAIQRVGEEEEEEEENEKEKDKEAKESKEENGSSGHARRGACNGEKDGEEKRRDQFSSPTVRRALLACAEHLCLVLVQKASQFTPSAFVSAVLHVAGALPPPRGSESFRRALHAALVSAVPRVPADLCRTLAAYAPAWLAEPLQRAQRGVRESEAAESRRLQQRAAEERACAHAEADERRRAEWEGAARRANELCRTNELGRANELSRANELGRTNELAAEGPAGTKRPRAEALVLMHAMPASELRAPPKAVPRTLAAAVAPPGKHPPRAAESQSTRQMNFVELLQRVAGKTESLLRPPRTDDIIGYGRHCLAKEVPIIPRRFAGREAYAAAFAPHIALELRYKVHSEFEEVAAACKKASWDKQERDKFKVLVKEEQVEVAPWVLENAVMVIAAGEATSSSLDQTQLLFSVSIASSENQQKGGLPQRQHLFYELSDGDVVLLLLPLASVAAALPHAFRVGKVPDEWQFFGCVPQICLVHSVQPAQRVAVLQLFTSPNASPSSEAQVTVSVTFVHALHAFRTGQKPFLLRRLCSVGSAISAMTAVHNVAQTPFARAIFEPHVEARTSRAYHEALEKIFSGERWPAASRELVLRDRLNEWQARAVAAVLFAVSPSWDTAFVSRGPPLFGNAPVSVPRLSASLPPAPSFLLIEGPPGTGKTQTIAALTLNILHFLPPHSSRRVLICAPSNCAVDEVLLRVRRFASLSRSAVGDLRLLRVGVRDRIAPEVLSADPPVFLDDCANAAGRGAAVPNDTLAGTRAHLREQLLRAAHVTCTTFGSLAQLQPSLSPSLPSSLSFSSLSSRRGAAVYDVVIVDEASQGTEPEALQALLRAGARAVLVGDARQLQPTVLCRAAAARGLRRSLLQRVLREQFRACMLREQYRMHADICAFPNERFYGGKLITQIAKRAAALPLAPGLAAAPRFAFVDVPDGRMTFGCGNSVMNRSEAAAVVAQMRRFRAALQLTPGQFGPHIGIITFYRAQKEAIVQMLSREERASGLLVATVDSFQGKEKDIIFISCVRAPRSSSSPPSASINESVSLGFVADWHRVNVALTRAKEFCVVFGNRHTFYMAAKETCPAPVKEEVEEEEEEEEGEKKIQKPSFLEKEKDDDEEVQIVDGPPPEEAEDDPRLLDRLVQHAREFSVEFKHTRELNVAMSLMHFKKTKKDR